MNAGERRLGLASALSLKAAADQIRVLGSLSQKTSEMATALKAIRAEGSILFIITAEEKLNNRGIKNLANYHVVVLTHLSPAEVLKYDFCVFTQAALDTLPTHFSS
jgi:ribosomal protein L4